MTRRRTNVPRQPRVDETVAGAIVFTVVVGFLGLIAFMSRVMAAGCGETGRHCNFAVIGLAQNPLIVAVPTLWAATIAWALVCVARGRRADRVLWLGGAAIGLYLVLAVVLTCLGSYML